MLELLVYEAATDPEKARRPVERIVCSITPIGGNAERAAIVLGDNYILKFDAESGQELKAAIDRNVRAMELFYKQASYNPIEDTWRMMQPEGGTREATPQEIEEAKSAAV